VNVKPLRINDFYSQPGETTSVPHKIFYDFLRQNNIRSVLPQVLIEKVEHGIRVTPVPQGQTGSTLSSTTRQLKLGGLAEHMAGLSVAVLGSDGNIHFVKLPEEKAKELSSRQQELRGRPAASL